MMTRLPPKRVQLVSLVSCAAVALITANHVNIKMGNA
jgi:hypothetical protein